MHANNYQVYDFGMILPVIQDKFYTSQKCEDISCHCHALAINLIAANIS